MGSSYCHRYLIWPIPPFPSAPRRGLYHRQGVNKHKGTQTEVIKASTPKQSSLDVWEVLQWRSVQAEIGKECMSFTFTLSHSLYSICEIKKPLSHGNRSCATQMVPSLFKWEAEPLSAVVLPVSCADLNLGSSLPSSASLSLSLHTRMQMQTNAIPLDVSIAHVKYQFH